MVDELSSQSLYIRHMDDCLVISQSEKANESLFRKLNALHEKIYFTKEVEINSEIPFLEILIKKSNNEASYTRKWSTKQKTLKR